MKISFEPFEPQNVTKKPRFKIDNLLFIYTKPYNSAFKKKLALG